MNTNKPTIIIEPYTFLERLKSIWLSIFVGRKELWWAIGIVLFGVGLWLIAPYMPFILPEIFSVPVVQTQLDEFEDITVIYPKMVIVGQPFQVSAIYNQSAPLSEEIEEVIIMIIPMPSVVDVEPSRGVFPVSDHIPNRLTQDIQVLIPITEPPVQQVSLQINVFVGRDTFVSELQLPLIPLPRFWIRVVLALGAIVSVQTLWTLVTRVFAIFRKPKADG